jgi:hypothetical protein
MIKFACLTRQVIVAVPNVFNCFSIYQKVSVMRVIASNQICLADPNDLGTHESDYSHGNACHDSFTSLQPVEASH